MLGIQQTPGCEAMAPLFTLVLLLLESGELLGKRLPSPPMHTDMQLIYSKESLLAQQHDGASSRELGNIIICAVYIPPSGITKIAVNLLGKCSYIQGNFNHCKLELALPFCFCRCM